jgi:hypothetical protein
VDGIMPISERVTRGLSLWLIAAVALATVGWTAAGRAGSLCSPQDHSCTPKASLTCCGPSSPDPSDAARLTIVAPPNGTPSHGSLMELEPFTRAPDARRTSRHAVQLLDLALLHCTLLI